MTEYRITWTIELTADTAEDAAREALRIHRDKSSDATAFEIRHPDGAKENIDLSNLEETKLLSSIEMTDEEFRESNDHHMGICLSCGEAGGPVESDAEKQPCENCVSEQVYGVAALLVMGKIEIIE